MNKGFKIRHNDLELCKAGFDNPHFVVNCIVNSMNRKGDSNERVELVVGGLNSDTGEHYKWLKPRALEIGDTLTIEVVSGPFDPPVEINSENSEQFILREKIKYFHRLKEELKDYLEE